jgi:uncharacterized membrane protein
MGRVTKSIEIEAPPEEVFNFLNDAEKMNKAHEGFTEVHYTSKEPVGVGTTGHFVNKNGTFDAGITEFIKNKKITWHTVEGSQVKVALSFILEPTTNGTKLINSFDYELPYSILGKLLDKVKVSKGIDKEAALWMGKAKQALEA